MTSTGARDDASAALRELILAGERYRIAAAAELHLTVNESRAVSYLLARGPMGQTDMAAALGLTTSSTTTLIDRLERRDMVERHPDPSDRRRSTVVIAEAAISKMSVMRSLMTHAFDGLPDERLPDVASILTTLATSLRAVTDDIIASQSPPPGRRRN